MVTHSSLLKAVRDYSICKQVDPNINDYPKKTRYNMFFQLV